MTLAYVGIGANLGPREETLRRAVGLLEGADGVGWSPCLELRETDPVGVVDQPPFLNGAVAVETMHSPRALLDLLLEIERSLGRVRGERWGPHSFTCSCTANSARQPGCISHLRDRGGGTSPGAPDVPHPRLHACGAASRLEPLADLNPELEIPSAGEPCRRLPARANTDLAMSHLDDLDEFEAELELSLKREYSAVFSLFRYCVLTQDATYLCNKLDLEALPQVSYPFFHVRMEDVWVWDKNRPSRIIPKAEVYTSGDVTVEELRAEGDEPPLTAEALAERIGQPLSGDDDSL